MMAGHCCNTACFHHRMRVVSDDHAADAAWAPLLMQADPTHPLTGITVHWRQQLC